MKVGATQKKINWNAQICLHPLINLGVYTAHVLVQRQVQRQIFEYTAPDLVTEYGLWVCLVLTTSRVQCTSSVCDFFVFFLLPSYDAASLTFLFFLRLFWLGTSTLIITAIGRNQHCTSLSVSIDRGFGGKALITKPVPTKTNSLPHRCRLILEAKWQRRFFSKTLSPPRTPRWKF